MTINAAQAAAFYAEILRHRQVWAIRDAAGFPAPKSYRNRAMPFWSIESRAQRVIDNVAAYHGFEPVVIPLDDWRSRWLPDLQKEGFDIGVNWSGSRATGFDVSPQDVERNLIFRETSRPDRPENPDKGLPEGPPE